MLARLAPQLDGRADMDDIQDALKDITGARSVPRVFVGGQFVGGGGQQCGPG